MKGCGAGAPGPGAAPRPRGGSPWLAVALAAVSLSQAAALVQEKRAGHQPLLAHGAPPKPPAAAHSLMVEKHVEATWDEVARGLGLALLAGGATSLGALALLFLPAGGPSPAVLAFATSLAAGVMLSVASEMIWPHLFSLDCWPLALFLGTAALCFALCRLGDLMVPHHHGSGQHVLCAAAPDPELASEAKRSEARSRRLTLLLFASLAAHNIPEGFAVAVSAISGKWFGVTICVAVALHNVPAGLTLAVATYDWTKSRLQATLVPTVAGLMEPLGAVLAMYFFKEHITEGLIENLLVAVAGVLFCIAVAELLPEAVSTRCWSSAGGGFVTGLAVMHFLHQVIDTYGGEDAHGHHHHGHAHGHAHSSRDFGF